MFVNNSEMWLEHYGTSESKAGVGSNGGLCKETVLISLKYMNMKSIPKFPTRKRPCFVLQNHKAKQNKKKRHSAFEVMTTVH